MSAGEQINIKIEGRIVSTAELIEAVRAATPKRSRWTKLRRFSGLLIPACMGVLTALFGLGWSLLLTTAAFVVYLLVGGSVVYWQAKRRA